MVCTLMAANHKVKSGYGTSQCTYGADEFPPLQGISQGNGSGPAIWAVISALLITLMRTKNYGISFLSCLSMTALVLIGFAFVDDTDLFHVAKDPYTLAEELLPQAQAMLLDWEGYLAATGGDLEEEKDFWYMIDFKWSKNKWVYKTI